MNYASFIKEIGRGAQGARDLGEDESRQLFGAMLDGGVPELELGAVVLSLRNKTESVGELLGFHRAADERLVQLRAPAGEARPVVIPTYNGARHQPNLLPLLVLLLKRLGVPVLIHGCLDGNGRVATAYILRELGILPCATAGQAQRALDQNHIALEGGHLGTVVGGELVGVDVHWLVPVRILAPCRTGKSQTQQQPGCSPPQLNAGHSRLPAPA